MKKFTYIYAVSFLSYIFLFITSRVSPITSDCAFYISLLSTICSAIYEIIYLIKLRKKENLSFKQTFFLGWFLSNIAFIITYIIYNITVYYKGITIGFFGAGKVYGLNALDKDLFGRIVMDPLALLSVFCVVIYIYKIKRKRSSS